jgi:hypothetical protein
VSFGPKKPVFALTFPDFHVCFWPFASHGHGINWIIQHFFKENPNLYAAPFKRGVKLRGPIKRFQFRPLLIIDSENLVIRRSSDHAIDKKQSSEMDPDVEELEHVGHGKDVGNPCSCNVR